MRTEHVYFIEDGDQIKIGRSYNPKKRLFQLRLEKTKHMKLLATLPMTYEEVLKEEKRLHHLFKNDQIKGEWFKKSDELLAFIGAINE